ncbi:pilin [Marinobacter xestospongiae]|nr:pilin [Marinobacter xestospongiae]
MTEGLNLAAEAKSSVGDFFSNRGRLPDNNASAGLAQPASISGNYVSSVTVGDDGRVNIEFGNRANAKITASGSKTLSLRPALNPAGSIVWICGLAEEDPGNVTAPAASNATDIDPRYLPTDCRQ